MLRLRRHRAPEQQPEFLDLGDGKSPERRRADARRAHYEHQRRLLEVKSFEHLSSTTALLEVKNVEQLISTLHLDKSAP